MILSNAKMSMHVPNLLALIGPMLSCSTLVLGVEEHMSADQSCLDVSLAQLRKSQAGLVGCLET